MRIVVFSDSHGSFSALNRIMTKSPDGDIYLFLGDGEAEIEKLMSQYPTKDIRCVCGNCDHGAFAPPSLVFEVEGVRIMAVHGHRHGVKMGTGILSNMALDNDCKVALYGHNHARFESYENGLYIMSPGSCALPRDGLAPSYGFVDIVSQGIITSIVNL